MDGWQQGKNNSTVRRGLVISTFEKKECEGGGKEVVEVDGDDFARKKLLHEKRSDAKEDEDTENSDFLVHLDYSKSAKDSHDEKNEN